jgi:hypothetical protein
LLRSTICAALLLEVASATVTAAETLGQFETHVRFRRPVRIRLERHGDFFTWPTGADSGSLERPGGRICIALMDPVYAGLVVCSRDQSRIEQAVFFDVVVHSRPIQIAFVSYCPVFPPWPDGAAAVR